MVTGRVDEVYFEQGMKVKEGDVLYTIEIDGLISEKEQLERKVNRLETENNNLLKLKNSILKNKNLFAARSPFRNHFEINRSVRKVWL